MLNEKVETSVGTNLFFVFVRLNELGTPEYHIVSREEVSQTVRESHRKWLSTPGLRGQARNETAMRKFRDPDNRYLGRWDLLGLD
jgi:hypothetical protein